MTRLRRPRRLFSSLSLVPLAGTLLLAACSTPERSSTRLRFAMGEPQQRSHLELELPAGWDHQVTRDGNGAPALLRLSSKPPEAPPQLRLAPRLVAEAGASSTALRTRAERELGAAAECAGVPASAWREQPAAGREPGLMLSCSHAAGASALTPAIAGVLLQGRLVVRFAILEHDAAVQAQAWSMLRSLTLATVIHTP